MMAATAVTRAHNRAIAKVSSLPYTLYAYTMYSHLAI